MLALPSIELQRPSIGSVNISSQLDDFEKARMEEKHGRARAVVLPGLLTFAVGALGFVVIFAVTVFDPNLSIITWNIVVCLSSFLWLCGALVVSSCSDFSIDDLVKNSAIIEVIFVVVGLMFALMLSAWPPYGGLLLVLYMLCWPYNRLCMKNKADFSLLATGFTLFHFIIITGIALCYGIMLNLNMDPNKYAFGGITLDLGNSKKWAYILIGCLDLTMVVVHMKYWCNSYLIEALQYKGSTAAFFHAIYAWTFMMATTTTLLGMSNYQKYPFSENTSLWLGITFFMPMIAFCCVGPTKISTFFTRKFDSDPQRMQRDGAFIATLLEMSDICIGKSYWVHRNKGEEDTTQKHIHNKFWSKGWVSNIYEDKFEVSQEGRDPVKFDLPMMIPANVLVDVARNSLRCIEWKNFSKDLFTTSIRDGQSNKSNEIESKEKETERIVAKADALYALSRPVEIGDAIDYFISHAWDDNPERKYSKIAQVATLFYKNHGRYPTFWFDKVCIHQLKIGLGLKVLPVNIMSSQKILALCGPSYSSRLWCVWEMFTLFAFMSPSQALEKIQIEGIGDEAGSGRKVLMELCNFNYLNAQCYSPNEQLKITKVIEAVGGDRFNSRVRHLAKACLGEDDIIPCSEQSTDERIYP